MKTGEFLAIVPKDAASENPAQYPTWGSAGLALEDREQLLHSGISKRTWCQQGPKRKQVWELEGTTDVAFTDRRLAYYCEKFVKGGKEFHVSSQVISRTVAAARRKGRAALGQVRYEWPTSVQLSSSSALGMRSSSLVLDCDVGGINFEVCFTVDKDAGFEWAIYATRLIASYRLAHAAALGIDEDARGALAAQHAEPTATESPYSGLIGKGSRFVYALAGARSSPF